MKAIKTLFINVLIVTLLGLTPAVYAAISFSISSDRGYYGRGGYENCRWVRAHWERGYWVPGQRVCYTQYYRSRGDCRWIPAHWEGRFFIPAHRVCY